jgi:Ca-activated chloride channel homolog
MLASAVLLINQCAPVYSQERCDLALVLALDVSRSMDTTEFELQFRGTATALRDPLVQAAILSQGNLIAITAFEWGGQTHQAMVADWSMLRSTDDLEAFAAALTHHMRGRLGEHTGTGTALEFAYEQLAKGPVCARSVIDVSSDGYSNDGQTPMQFYSSVQSSPVTVNALVVGGKLRPVLWEYFRTDVIHGPGSFAMATESFEDYQQAIREKLLREIAPAALIADSK